MHDVKNLIISGGGIPGLFAFLGALKQLRHTREFSYANLEKVAGSSVGSIFGLMIALKYTPRQIAHMLFKIDFTKFKQKNIVRRLYRLFTTYSTLDSNLIYDLLVYYIQQKFPNRDPESVTFRDLHDNGFKDLYVITTKFYLEDQKTRCEAKIFSYETAADTSVALAVYASTAAPFFFPKVRLKEVSKGKFIQSPDGDLYDDGGLMNNYLIELFDKMRYIPDVDPKMFQDGVTNPHTLGLNLDVLGKKDAKHIVTPLTSKHPWKYFKALIRTTITFDKKNLNEHNKQRTIDIDRDGKPFFAFNMDDGTKQKLIQAGREAVIDYFAALEKEEKETPKPIAMAKAG